MKILLELDHPDRDIKGLCFLAKLLLKNRKINSVCIASREYINFNFLKKNKFKIIIFSQPRNKKISIAKSLGSYVVVHETEGLPYNKSWIFHGVSKNIQKSIDEVWVWGIEQKNFMDKSKDLRYLKGKNFVTGSARYEYYKKLKKSKLRKKVQLNTNYPVLSPKFRDLESELKEWSHPNNFKYNSRFFIDLLHQTSRRERSLFNLKNLIKNKNFEISIRTHPFESNNYYKKHKTVKDLKVSYKENTDIHEDLSDCFACLNSGCQTTLDCIIRDVIPISFEKTNFWDEYSLSINEFKDLDELYLNRKKYLSKLNKKLNSKGLSKKIYNLQKESLIENQFEKFLNSIEIREQKYITKKIFHKFIFKLKEQIIELMKNIYFIFHKRKIYTSKIANFPRELTNLKNQFNKEKYYITQKDKTFIIERN